MIAIEKSPWPTLTLIVSLEAIFLSTFVMISQNRADEKRQVLASQEWQSVQLEEKQNEQLLDLSKQILKLTDAIHTLTIEHAGGPDPALIAEDPVTNLTAVTRTGDGAADTRPGCTGAGLRPRFRLASSTRSARSPGSHAIRVMPEGVVAREDLQVRSIRGGIAVIASNGFWLWWTLALIVWVAIAFWPARVAGRKGHSFFLYFLFSLVFFPAALIVAYLVPDRSAPGLA